MLPGSDNGGQLLQLQWQLTRQFLSKGPSSLTSLLVSFEFWLEISTSVSFSLGDVGVEGFWIGWELTEEEEGKGRGLSVVTSETSLIYIEYN